MLRLLLFTLLPISCPAANFSNWSPQLSYEVYVKPAQDILKITGTLEAVHPGTYYFILPRTQGAPLNDFINSIEFSDEKGVVAYTLTEDNEWRVKTRGTYLNFTYTINLGQSVRYAREAWGGATNVMTDNTAFLNGSFTFVIPLVKGITAPIELKWEVPPAWKVVTPWTVGQLQTSIPSQYALVRNYYAVYREGSLYTRRIHTMDLNTVWLGEDDINAFPQAQRAINKVVEAALTLFGYEASREAVTLILRDTNTLNQFRASTEANSIEFNFKEGITFSQLWSTYREGFLRLLAHEIIHTWDRREIEHASSYLHVPEWGPDTCWIREGFTEYFAMLNLFNAEIYDRTQFLNAMHSLASVANEVNASKQFSLSNGCALFYENKDALQYTYTEGASLAFTLDLLLRQQSSGVKSLPVFMQRFLTKYRYQEKTVDAFISEWNDYAPTALRNLEAQINRMSPTSFSKALQAMGISQQQGPDPDFPSWIVSPNASFKWYFK